MHTRTYNMCVCHVRYNAVVINVKKNLYIICCTKRWTRRSCDLGSCRIHRTKVVNSRKPAYQTEQSCCMESMRYSRRARCEMLRHTHLITLRASCGAVYCSRSCLFATGGWAVFVGWWVCGSFSTTTRNCVHRSSPKWVCR